MQTSPHYLRFVRALTLASGIVGSGCAAAVGPDGQPDVAVRADTSSRDGIALDVARDNETIEIRDAFATADATDVPSDVWAECPATPPFAWPVCGGPVGGDGRTIGSTCVTETQNCQYTQSAQRANCVCGPTDGGAGLRWQCEVSCFAVGPLNPPDLAA